MVREYREREIEDDDSEVINIQGYNDMFVPDDNELDPLNKFHTLWYDLISVIHDRKQYTEFLSYLQCLKNKKETESDMSNQEETRPIDEIEANVPIGEDISELEKILKEYLLNLRHFFFVINQAIKHCIDYINNLHS